MNRANLQVFASFLLVVGCAAPPPSDESIGDTIVYTRHGPDVDFASYATFYVRPEVLTSDDEGDLAPPEITADGTALVAATVENMEARGYVEAADPASADIGIQLFYLDHVTTSYWCYSWWDPWYWGYPGWGYYPYYGACDGTAWQSGMTGTVMVDLKAAREGDPGAGAGGAGGAGGEGPVPKVAGIWFSGVYGVSLGSAESREGIDQAFQQSPYIQASP